jgi:hypothetical protein
LLVRHASASLLHLYLTAHLREIHREQLSIEHSLSDLDSAVGRLDNLFMSLYVVVAALIIAVTLVGTFFCLLSSWTKLLCLGSPTCFVNHRDWHSGSWYVISYISYFSFGKFLTRPRTGLSWLIGSSLHDILTSIIFLFVRHPFDVGDKIDLGETGVFTVKEIRLLSTILLNGHGGYVQVSNNVLANLVRPCDLNPAAILTAFHSSFKIFAGAPR